MDHEPDIAQDNTPKTTETVKEAPAPGAKTLQSPDFWREKFASPVFTGVAASVVMLVMKLIGMLPVGWLIVLLPAIAGFIVSHQVKKKGAPPKDPPQVP